MKPDCMHILYTVSTMLGLTSYDIIKGNGNEHTL